jgi:hypothetical protein
MTTHTLRAGQAATVAADQWDGSSLAFASTGSTAATVTFTGSNTLAAITDTAGGRPPSYATINLTPGAALTTNALTVKSAHLAINEGPGTSVTLNGTDRISNDSTLTATGNGAYTVNGTMNIDGTSTVNMDYVAVNGTGTFHLTGEDALLRLGSVGQGETVALDGGILSLTNGMSFLGTITDTAPATSRIGPIAAVDVYNAMTAVSETFNQTTGVLDLLNAQGSVVANLKFAGTGDLYAAPTTGLATNCIVISSHPGGLPVTFTS